MYNKKFLIEKYSKKSLENKAFQTRECDLVAEVYEEIVRDLKQLS